MNTSKFKNIFFEYSFTKNNPDNKVIVLFDGIPSDPSKSNKKDCIFKLNTKGFDVFYPRYSGCWESAGEFLQVNPVYEIDAFIKKISQGIKLKDKKYSSKNIFILGSSFGGGIALSLKDEKYIKKICVLSPVVSFRQVKGIETLGDYLKREHRKNYRFKKINWQKLINDKIFCPFKSTKIKFNKILILAGKLDGQINYVDLKKYAKENTIQIKILSNFGHITLTKIKTLNKIIKFFNNN